MALFPEEDNAPLKKWIIKRLENTSDADADVLADYVLALLRHDGSIAAVRELCEHEIPDFLKEDSTSFVNDVFEAINYKTYLPGAAMPPRRPPVGFAPPTGPAGAALGGGQYGGLGRGAPMGPANGARKRSWNDRGDGEFQGGNGGDVNGRSYKQPRRGGPGGMGRGTFDGGRGGFDGGRGGFNGVRGGFDNGRGGFGRGYGNQQPQFNPPPQGLPGFTDPMAGVNDLAWNAADPMSQLALLGQIMGLPPVTEAGVPAFPPASTPIPMGRGGYGGPPRKQRCRDYDIKGFCARGNTCMFEHGENSVWIPPQPKVEEYDPNTSLMAGVEGSASPVSNIPNIQLRGGFRGRGRGMQDRPQFSHPNKRGGRSELSAEGPNYDDKSLTTVVIENIPEEAFDKGKVEEFFSEFGNIKDVDMRPYKRLAIVKYDTWDSALSAYKSPKVIFDNRFVKVYWYKDADSLPIPLATGADAFRGAAKNGEPKGPVPARATSEPELDIEEFTKRQAEAQKSHEEKMKKKQETEAAKLEVVERLKKQAEEQRKLMEKIAAKTGKSASPAVDSANGTPAPETKSTSQTEALKAQLAALEAEAQSLGIDPTQTEEAPYWAGRGRGRGRGRGAYVPRGFRGGYRGRGAAPFAAALPRTFKLDNRTKKVGLSGIDFSASEKDEGLRTYLLGIGEFTEIEVTPTRTAITFKDRFTAEKFMYSTPGGEIPGVGKVEMAWIQTPLPPVNINPTLPSTGASTPTSTKAEGKIEQPGPDVTMADAEGDAMSSPAKFSSSSREERHEPQQSDENLDYDVADENDWAE